MLPLRATLVAVCVVVPLSSQAKKAPPKPTVIYGADGRLNPYEIDSEDPMLERSRSTVLLVRKHALHDTDASDVKELRTTAYGESENLCKGERFEDEPSADGAFCSGFLVGPHTVVTAGHCIDESDCDRVAFVFGYALEEPDAKPNQISTKEIYSCKKVVGQAYGRSRADYAVVHLDRAVKGHKPLKLATNDNLHEGDALTVIGYPEVLPVKIAGGAVVRDNDPDDYFVANLDTFAGNSGSAVLSDADGVVEGILVRGDRDFTYRGEEESGEDRSCYVEHHCDETACRGEDVSRTRTFRKYVEESESLR